MANQDEARTVTSLEAYEEIDSTKPAEERRTTTLREVLGSATEDVCSIRKNVLGTEISWLVDPGKDKHYYFGELVAFYKKLSSGNYTETKTCPPKPVWMIGPGGRSEIKYSLQELAQEDSPVPRESLFQNFRLLHIQTPFGTFYLHDPKEGKIWTPETGKIYVYTRQNISRPIAELHFNTARHKTDTEQLSQRLREYLVS